MGVTVDPGVVAGLVPEATIILQARSSAAPDRLLAAMRAAAADLRALDGSAYVGPVIPLPDGPVVVADLGTTPPRRLRKIPKLFARRLAEAGAGDATLAAPPSATPRYLPLRRLAPAARALLHRRPGPGSDALLSAVADWLPGEHRPGCRLAGMAGSVAFDLAPDAVVRVLRPVLAAGTTAVAVTTDFAGWAAAAVVGGVDPAGSAALTAAGGSADDVAAALRRQRHLVLRYAGTLSWAGVTAEPDASDLLFPQWRDRDEPPGRPPVDRLADLLVPDAMWCQLLSPGHLARLGGPPPGAVEIAPERFELTVGEPEQWLPGHPDREALRRRGRELLAGCLVSADEATALARERVRAAALRPPR
jgi:hypothetical protein